MISFWIPGRAQPAGSKRWLPARGKVGGHPIVVDANRKAAPWKLQVAIAARAAYRGAPLEGPVKLSILFRLARPKSHRGKSGLLLTHAPQLPIAKPDLLKLARGVEDALTGIVYFDDAQIIQEKLEKVYAEADETLVQVEPIPPAAAMLYTNPVTIHVPHGRHSP